MCVVAADDNTAAAVGGGIAALAVLIILILIIGAFVFVKYKRRVQKKQPVLGRYGCSIRLGHMMCQELISLITCHDHNQ